MTTENKEPELISASQLSRRANMPLGKTIEAHPVWRDPAELYVHGPPAFLFDAGRVDEVRNRFATVERALPESLIPA
jgi:hypothetical protein